MKKRKSQEKEREARATELQKKRQVGTNFMSDMFGRKIVVMISTNYAD